MKLLFDQNISYRIEKGLSDIFNESKHISNLGLLDKDDIEIWEFAKKENYSIVTFDSDFYDLSILKGIPPKIVWIRRGNLTTKEIIKVLEQNHLTIRNFITNPDKKDITCLEIA